MSSYRINNYPDSWKIVSAAGPTGGGHGNTLAIKSDNTLWSWGSNFYGQLGQENAIHRSSPVQIGSALWTQISSNLNHSLAIKNDGTLWAWGNNNYGQLGQGNRFNRSKPVQVGFLNTWKFISAGLYCSFGINEENRLYSWGRNFSGCLGQGDTIHRSIPSQVGVNFWKMVSGDASILGIQTFNFATTSRGLWAWGANSSGQLGLNDTNNRSAPVQVDNTNTWDTVSTKGLHSTAIKSNGTLWTWGDNVNGQLGQNNIISRSSPVQVGTSSWTSVSAATSYTVAIKSDNTLWTWGRNYNGQLGQGDRIHRSSPVQVGTSSWSSISAGNSYTVAIKPDGTLWSWGSNTLGQLGLGDQNSRSSPTILSSSKKFIDIVGDIHDNFLNSYGISSSRLLTYNIEYIDKFQINSVSIDCSKSSYFILDFKTLTYQNVLNKILISFTSAPSDSYTCLIKLTNTLGIYYGWASNVITNHLKFLPPASSGDIFVKLTTRDGGYTWVLTPVLVTI